MKHLAFIPALLLIAMGSSISAQAADKKMGDVEKVTVYKISNSGIEDKIGHIKFEQQHEGVLITPDLKNLEAGLHGFHVHENPSCEPGKKDGEMAAGVAAGGHLDVDGAGSHAGPYKKGHLGDLPALYVDEKGNATLPVLAPKVELHQLRGHALIIHAGGDTYSEPPKLGGGGDRIACGVIGKAGKQAAK